jgi:hypothetical protein
LCLCVCWLACLRACLRFELADLLLANLFLQCDLAVCVWWCLVCPVLFGASLPSCLGLCLCLLLPFFFRCCVGCCLGVCAGVSLSSCCLGGCACGLFVSDLCLCVCWLACLFFCCCFDVCVCTLNLGDLGCWGWVGASVSCCLYVCVWCLVCPLSFGASLPSCLGLCLCLLLPLFLLVLCWLLLVVCVGVSLSSCCLGGCACGLFVSFVSVCLLACLSSFVVVLMCVSAF